jgi:hypothetical protein
MSCGATGSGTYKVTQVHWEGIFRSVNINELVQPEPVLSCPCRNVRTLHRFEWNGEVMERNRSFCSDAQ